VLSAHYCPNLRLTVISDIVFGGIGEIQQRPVGGLTFELTGPDGAVHAALAALRGR
jgi:D-methionine transport system ATP-binding protein